MGTANEHPRMSSACGSPGRRRWNPSQAEAGRAFSEYELARPSTSGDASVGAIKRVSMGRVGRAESGRAKLGVVERKREESIVSEDGRV
eukprot:4980346-Pleurochrysis_carterae.AAC.1